MTFLPHFHDHTSGVPFLPFNMLPRFLKNFDRILFSGLFHIPLIAIMSYKSYGEYSIKQKIKRFIVPVAFFLCAFSEFSFCFSVIEDRLVTTIFKTNLDLSTEKSSTRIFIRYDSYYLL